MLYVTVTLSSFPFTPARSIHPSNAFFFWTTQGTSKFYSKYTHKAGKPPIVDTHVPTLSRGNLVPDTGLPARPIASDLLNDNLNLIPARQNEDFDLLDGPFSLDGRDDRDGRAARGEDQDDEYEDLLQEKRGRGVRGRGMRSSRSRSPVMSGSGGMRVVEGSKMRWDRPDRDDERAYRGSSRPTASSAGSRKGPRDVPFTQLQPASYQSSSRRDRPRAADLDDELVAFAQGGPSSGAGVAGVGRVGGDSTLR